MKIASIAIAGCFLLGFTGLSLADEVRVTEHRDVVTHEHHHRPPQHDAEWWHHHHHHDHDDNAHVDIHVDK